MNDEGLTRALEELREQHRALDMAINALQAASRHDQVEVARLKKRKLGLRDRISEIEDQLLPDIIA